MFRSLRRGSSSGAGTLPSDAKNKDVELIWVENVLVPMWIALDLVDIKVEQACGAARGSRDLLALFTEPNRSMQTTCRMCQSDVEHRHP